MNNIMANALDLTIKIHKLGYDAYIIGGAVRDLMLNKTPSDVDISTNCPINILQSNFDTFFVGNSQKYNTVVILYYGVPYEVTQFREEQDYDGANPAKVVFVSSLASDVKRRDFTINSMAMNYDGNIIDHEGGKRDIELQLIKAVGDPDKRFTEDYVRMIRAARFAALDGFKIESNTAESIKKNAHLITQVTPERINLEIVKAFKKSGQEAAKFILNLDELMLLHYILPEVENLKNFIHNPDHHPEGPTVFDHTIECIKLSTSHMGYVTKLSILLHDIGKPPSATPKEGSIYPSYNRHESIGAEMAYEILLRYKFSVQVMESVTFAVSNHMKFHNILDMKPSKIMKLVCNPDYAVLKDTAWADEFSRGEKFSHYGDFENKLKLINELTDKWKSNIKGNEIKIVNGSRIMNVLNIPQGPLVGIIKSAVEEHIIDNSLQPTQEELDVIITNIRKSLAD